MTLDAELRDEYIGLFDTCEVKPVYQEEVDEFLTQLMKGQIRYQTIQNMTRVPWFVVGLIHGMECSFSFEQHLHNGDSLKNRTVHVPAGRPKTGNPPFRWEDSAADALEYDGFTGWYDWSIPGICFKLEGYNGWGTRRYHHVNTPYLWAFSNHYSHGKYTSDGQWNTDAVSKQCGAITALKQMVDKQQVAFASPNGMNR